MFSISTPVSNTSNVVANSSINWLSPDSKDVPRDYRPLLLYILTGDNGRAVYKCITGYYDTKAEGFVVDETFADYYNSVVIAWVDMNNIKLNNSDKPNYIKPIKISNRPLENETKNTSSKKSGSAFVDYLLSNEDVASCIYSLLSGE